jgi:hypothetical protein
LFAIDSDYKIRGMKRCIAIALAVAGCDGATGLVRDAGIDAEVHATAAFTPLLCTSGRPGEPTCPINHVDVGDIADGAKLQMLAIPTSTRVFLHDIALTAGPAGLFVRELRFVVYRDGVAIPQLGPFSPVIDLASDEVLTIEAAALEGFDVPGPQLGLQYGATR